MLFRKKASVSQGLYGIQIYVLDFSNANLKLFTNITLYLSDKSRLAFERNVKTKAWERFVLLSFKRKPPKKVSSK